MLRSGRQGPAAFTLLELVMVIALLGLLAAMAVPSFLRRARRERLANSARDLRSLIVLTRANAMTDGLRYRIRFAEEDEDLSDDEDWRFQPVVEYEADPREEPGEFTPVKAAWTRGTFASGVRCSEVKRGRPRLEDETADSFGLDEEEDDDELPLPWEQDEETDEGRPAVVFQPDGTSEWATFVLTDAPVDESPEDSEQWRELNVILDGVTGRVWVQRPLREEELELLEEYGLDLPLRFDLLRADALAEDDIVVLRGSS